MRPKNTLHASNHKTGVSKTSVLLNDIGGPASVVGQPSNLRHASLPNLKDSLSSSEDERRPRRLPPVPQAFEQAALPEQPITTISDKNCHDGWLVPLLDISSVALAMAALWTVENPDKVEKAIFTSAWVFSVGVSYLLNLLQIRLGEYGENTKAKAGVGSLLLLGGVSGLVIMVAVLAAGAIDKNMSWSAQKMVEKVAVSIVLSSGLAARYLPLSSCVKVKYECKCGKQGCASCSPRAKRIWLKASNTISEMTQAGFMMAGFEMFKQSQQWWSVVSNASGVGFLNLQMLISLYRRADEQKKRQPLFVAAAVAIPLLVAGYVSMDLAQSELGATLWFAAATLVIPLLKWAAEWFCGQKQAMPVATPVDNIVGVEEKNTRTPVKSPPREVDLSPGSCESRSPTSPAYRSQPFRERVALFSEPSVGIGAMRAEVPNGDYATGGKEPNALSKK